MLQETDLSYRLPLTVSQDLPVFEIGDTNILEVRNWTCSVCDGDDETGCQMSDPQNCPYGRGI